MREDELGELKRGLRRSDGLDQVRCSAVEPGRWLVDHIGDERAATALAVRTQRKDDWDECWATRARIKEDVARRLEKADDAALRAAALCVVLWPEEPYSDFDDILKRVTRRRLDWTVEQASVLWRLAASDQERGFRWVKCVKLGLAALKGLEEPELQKLAPSLRTVEEMLPSAWGTRGADRARLPQAVRSYLALAGGSPADLPDSVLVPRDRWAGDLREWLGAEPLPHLVELIIHLATLASGRPTAAWRGTCEALALGEGAREFGRRALAGLVECDPTTMRRHGKQQRVLLDVRNQELARGVVWMAALTEGPAAVAALEAVFLRTSYDTFAYFPEPKVATAAVHALGVIPGPESSAALRRLLARTHHAGDRKQITAALSSP
ncbi:hypothetical protein [Actinomadura welshii]|uniref:hypothetical protein n=1 Tax=Actinomadura welshii TaxID=3103817 RepID=UPI000409BB23|nr:hypothetical protein [Actinomadura madurae]